MTSLSLLIAALAEALEDHPIDNFEPVDGFSPRKLRYYYLVNPEEDSDRHYKLILSQTDKESLIAVIERRELPVDLSLRIKENYALFTLCPCRKQSPLVGVTMPNNIRKVVVFPAPFRPKKPTISPSFTDTFTS